MIKRSARCMCWHTLTAQQRFGLVVVACACLPTSSCHAPPACSPASLFSLLGKPQWAGPTFRPGDPRAALAVNPPDPRIHFALNCGAASCPPIRVFKPASLEAGLEAAAQAFCAGEAWVEPCVASLLFGTGLCSMAGAGSVHASSKHGTARHSTAPAALCIRCIWGQWHAVACDKTPEILPNAGEVQVDSGRRQVELSMIFKW